MSKALVMSVTITPSGGSPTTLCDGVGYRDDSHWGYLDIQTPAQIARQISSPIRASVSVPLTRVTVSPQLRLRVERLYPTVAQAKLAALMLPFSAVPAGAIAIVVYTDAGGTINISSAALASCQPVTSGCTLTVDWTYDIGSATAS